MHYSVSGLFIFVYFFVAPLYSPSVRGVRILFLDLHLALLDLIYQLNC